MQTTFLLGSLDDEHLRLTILKRSIPEATDYWDGNWVDVRIEVSVGGFSADYPAQIRNVELFAFEEELARLYETLDGEAEFLTMEYWLEIRVQGDGMGHLKAHCIARDDPGFPNELRFTISFDQTFLPQVLRDLRQIRAMYPVLGRSDA